MSGAHLRTSDSGLGAVLEAASPASSVGGAEEAVSGAFGAVFEGTASSSPVRDAEASAALRKLQAAGLFTALDGGVGRHFADGQAETVEFTIQSHPL